MEQKEQYYQEEIESKLRVILEVLEEMANLYENPLIGMVVFQIKRELESISEDVRKLLMKESE